MSGPRPGWLELRCGASLRAVRALTGMLEVALDELGVGASVRHDLSLAVAELVANVVQHEYRGQAGDVALRAEVQDGHLVLQVDSAGPTFDLRAALAASLKRDPLADLEGRGMGLRLIASLFDDASCAPGPGGAGNRITLRRAIGQ